MNWDEGDSESSSEKETSTDDSFCSLMSIPDGKVQVIRGNSEKSVYHQEYLGSVSRGTIDGSEEQITDHQYEPI